MATLQSKLILTLQDQVSGRMRAMSAQIAAFRTRMRAATLPVMGMTGRLAALGGGYLGVTAGFRGTIGAAIKFEEAFADVRKVLNGTPGELAQVRHQIIEMSKVLPTSAEGIAEIYAAAAQSNIPFRELGKFSEMVAKVAVAWDVTEGETSQALAEIKTQLAMGVDEIGLYADAINHLSNNTAARAPDLVDFSKRVAAQGNMYGFAAQESLAFGSAMIAMGAQSNVAATSFRNMGLGLADASGASKKTQASFRKLGLDYRKMAKRFSDDATGTMLNVFDRIQGLAEHERIETAISIFGREARALMPVINNTKELRRQLGLVAKEANYSGSAFEEYLERANTAGNALRIIGNKIRAVGIGIGTSWLPEIKAFGAGIGDVLDTLKKRVGVFDQISVAVGGLMTGLGYGGPEGLRAMVNDLGDLIFGKAHTGDGIDERVTQLARLSNQFRQIGRDIKEFAAAVADNPVAKFLGEMAGHGFKFMLATTGIVLLAGAIRKLGSAMLFLSGATAAIAILKSLAGFGGAIFGAAGKAGRAPMSSRGGAPTGGKTPAGKVPKIAGIGALFASVGAVTGTLLAIDKLLPDDHYLKLMGTDADPYRRKYRDGGSGPLSRGRGRPGRAFPGSPYITGAEPVLHPSLMNENLEPGPPDETGSGFDWRRFLFGKAAEEGFNLREHMREGFGKSSADPLPTLESIRDAVGRAPAGTHEVREINPTPVHAPINVTVYATTMADAGQIASQVGARVQDTLAGYYSDGAYA